MSNENNQEPLAPAEPKKDGAGRGLEAPIIQVDPSGHAETPADEVIDDEAPVVFGGDGKPSVGASIDEIVNIAPTSGVEILASEDDQPTDGTIETKVDMKVRRTRSGPNPHAELTNNPLAPLGKAFRRFPGEVLPVLPATLSELDQLFANVRRIDPTGSAAGKAWLGALQNGREVMTTADAGVDSLVREGSLWRQSVNAGAVEIAAGAPKLGEARGDMPLVGEEAMLRLQAALGGSRMVRTPLWHSGIWINLKAPTEAQLLELERRLGNEKITLGRMTNGLIFSNVSVYHHSYLFNFALSLVFECSIAGFTTAELKKRILLTDMPTLLWALASAIYPNGYRYHRPCISDPTVCTHVVEELLDLSRLSWTDQNALTEAQRKQMIRKTAKFPDVELERYREQHRYASKGEVVLKKSRDNLVTMQLRVPTLADYEETGFAWVETIDSQTQQAFGTQLTGESRNSYILEQAQMTSLRQYAHWIQRIVINGQQVIEDRKTLEETIGTLTNDADVRDAFFDGVRQYIADTTISMIAIPTYVCPICKVEQQSEEEMKHPHLIPLDMAMVFFILLGQRVNRLLAETVI